MKYWLHYEMEECVEVEERVEVEDGHVTEAQVHEALKRAIIADVTELATDGIVTITEAGENAGADYKIRVSAKSSSYPGGPDVVDFETV